MQPRQLLASMVCQGSPDVPPTRQQLLGGVRESSAGNQPNLPNGLTCWCEVRCGDPGLPVTLATSRCPLSPYPSPEGWGARSNSDTATCLDRVSWQMDRNEKLVAPAQWTKRSQAACTSPNQWDPSQQTKSDVLRGSSRRGSLHPATLGPLDSLPEPPSPRHCRWQVECRRVPHLCFPHVDLMPASSHREC